ncbi:tRNA (adenosine(37)-N6)-dimethylallyltransferase MiaA [Salegentibacter sp. F188]|uniref:tRNA dimethylallyltransferase n=1 Tax=Autumnicola patrickiae TaxID=3075591 RepID=A0ABU3DX18_9FLAO|nr:tRNA (adenosine(37)-N6)-dimethylallyltransferase MiaA [Salegentibacter sp. F188]MDT0688271.1 tRNA (adenosine(37)-N6)-dimethylallyltransferase MiaA [Salegentibacter sp. F188]
MPDPFLITIVGPTAIGKTALGIKLAQHFDTEILSADSRQFFKEMKIGTAVPEEEELQAAPHHFIQHISVEEEYSVGDFERDAIAKLEELFQRKKVVVMVGGSGLYVKSILEGLDYFPEVDPQIRADLNNESLENLQRKLANFDPDYYQKVDAENPHRLIRALEICIGTGKTYSSFLNRKKEPRNFRSIQIGLTAEREKIYERINLRVDKMMETGLPEEAKKLFPKRHLNALNTVGYKELFLHLEGKISEEEAVAEIKKNTRRFAKRQLTWFKKDTAIAWFKNTTPPEEIIAYAEKQIKDSSQ